MREKAIPGQQKDRQQLGIYVENIENITLPAFRAARVQVNAYSILFVIAGELELNTGDNSYSVPDGHGILLCRKEYIAVTAGGETGCQWIEVRFDGNSAGANLIQEAKNSKYKALILISRQSRVLKAKAGALQGYVTIFGPEDDILTQIQRWEGN